MRSDWAEPDTVLANYVSLTDQLVEHVDPGTPFTLTVSGLVIDGELIPQWQWFGELSELNDHEDAYYVGMAEYDNSGSPTTTAPTTTTTSSTTTTTTGGGNFAGGIYR